MQVEKNNTSVFWQKDVELSWNPAAVTCSVNCAFHSYFDQWFRAVQSCFHGRGIVSTGGNFGKWSFPSAQDLAAVLEAAGRLVHRFWGTDRSSCSGRTEINTEILGLHTIKIPRGMCCFLSLFPLFLECSLVLIMVLTPFEQNKLK